MTLSSFEKAVLLSISYSSVFSFPLTSREIWLRLIYKQPISHQRVKEVLDSLILKNIIQTNGKYFSILDDCSTDIRKISQNFSNLKRSEADSFVDKARLIPFIKAIVITGSVSVNNAKQNDDIDWLIITKKDTLWIVRPLVILLAIISGKRRERNGNHRDNSWCFNMFLSEESLEVIDKNKNIYTAYELFQADFVYDQGGIERKFLANNSWAKKYLANYWLEKNKRLTLDKVCFCEEKNANLTQCFKYLNIVSFYIQYQYMKKAITREIVQIDKALFHPRNTHRNILTQWKKIIKQISNAY
ncbi:MAG: hypothetical protein GW941_01330 [Candidatus Pacebacteria bacterium]|nr:hypothetical protein [Candidatus Paceibacterota bacterium]